MHKRNDKLGLFVTATATTMSCVLLGILKPNCNLKKERKHVLSLSIDDQSEWFVSDFVMIYVCFGIISLYLLILEF